MSFRTVRDASSRLVIALWLGAAPVALAQEPVLDDEGAVVTPAPDGSASVTSRTSLPRASEADHVDLNFPIESSLLDWIRFFAELRGMNFVLPDLREVEAKKVTILSHAAVSPDAAWEAFLSVLDHSGYAVTVTARTAHLVKTGDPTGAGLAVGEPRDTAAYVTQLVPLEHTRVDAVTKIVETLVGPNARTIAYLPANTLVVTDTAANVRKVWQVLRELDIAEPGSRLEVYPLRHAEPQGVKRVLDELYGDEGERTAADPGTTRSRAPTRTASRDGGTPTRPAILQSIADERTNALLVVAGEDGHAAAAALITQLDHDVRFDGQIHIVPLEHAKAAEVLDVLEALSEEPETPPRGAAQTRDDGSATDRTNAFAAFDGELTLAADEATNALVIVAPEPEFEVVRGVIEKLDIERRQVYVDVVVLELSSDDAMSLGLAVHGPASSSGGTTSFVGAQLGATSLGLTEDALTGLALGVFGKSVDVPVYDSSTGTSSTWSIPAWGIALNAMKSTGVTNIVGNPSLTTLDHQEASLVVGRTVPFATTSSLNSAGQAVTSFEREDVATVLKLTPHINGARSVTLELSIEVSEVEESAQSTETASSGGGYITSQRKIETVALVGDNATVAIGGLVATTETRTESRIPILGDIPVLGALFRKRESAGRTTDLVIFLTPHIVDQPADALEVHRVKEAQRQEFLRRFYGKSRDEFWAEMRDLLRFSVNSSGEASEWGASADVGVDVQREP